MRWLKAPVVKQDGSREERTKGSPQGLVISPLLANLFMHYAFDLWMKRTYPEIPFELAYADDVTHARAMLKRGKCARGGPATSQGVPSGTSS